jgi:hypothetical protein
MVVIIRSRVTIVTDCQVLTYYMGVSYIPIKQFSVSVYRVYCVSIDNILMCVCEEWADHSGRAFQGMNCLRPRKHWDRGFEFRLRHGCLCAFILCLCRPVCR